MTPTTFKVRIMEGVGRMSGPFTFSDIAADLGLGYDIGEPGEDRLRRGLRALTRSGAIAVEARGVYRMAPGGAVGPGVDLARAVETFMLDNGGMARAEEMRLAFDLDDTADRRRLHRTLDLGRYQNLPAMSDGRAWWTLPDAKRLALPSPGWRIEADLSLEAFRSGRPWRRLPVTSINARRREIGRGIRTAREAAGLSIADVLATVESMFVADLERGRTPVLAAAASGAVPLSRWWADQVEDMGDSAAMIAWVGLERGGGVGTAWAGAALSAATWVGLASSLEADPAALSRGRHRLGENP